MATEDPPPLPKGVGRIPQWWMEITPHDTLFLAEDAARREHANAEAEFLARKAAEADLMQKYGGEGFPDWNPAEHGPRTPEEEKEWVSKGYTRLESTNQWVNESGAPLEGRQFQGKMPPGYTAGEYSAGGMYDPAKFGGSALKSTSGYARDEDKQWDKPDWMKVKLKATGKGGMENLERGKMKINKGNGATAAVRAPAPAPAGDDVEYEEEVIEEEEVIVEEEVIEEEVYVEEEVVDEFANLSPELRVIMERRAKTNG